MKISLELLKKFLLPHTTAYSDLPQTNQLLKFKGINTVTSFGHITDVQIVLSSSLASRLQANTHHAYSI